MKKILYFIILIIYLNSSYSAELPLLWRRDGAPNIEKAQFHPTSDLLAFKYDGNIKIWDYTNDEIPFHYTDVNMKSILYLNFSNDGNSLFAIYNNQDGKTEFRQWDWQNSELEDSYSLHDSLSWAALAPNEEYICGIADSQLVVISKNSKTVKHRFDVTSGKWAYRATFMNGSKDLIVLQTKTAKIISIESGEVTSSIGVNNEKNSELFVSPNNKFLAILYSNRNIDFFDIENSNYIRSYNDTKGLLNPHWNSDSSFYYSNSYGVCLVNFISGKIDTTYKGINSIYDLKKIGNGNILSLISLSKNSIIIFSTIDGVINDSYGQTVTNMLFTENNEHLILPKPKLYGSIPEVFLLNRKTGEIENVLYEMSYYGYAGNNDYYLLDISKRIILKYNLLTNKLSDSLLPTFKSKNTPYFSEDGKYCFLRTESTNEIAVINLHSKDSICTLYGLLSGNFNYCNDIVSYYNPDSMQPIIIFYDFSKQDTLSVINDANYYKWFAISPEKKYFYDYSGDSLRKRIINDGSIERIFKGFTFEQADKLKLSPSGLQLISAVEKGSVKIFDTETGELTNSFTLPDLGVFAIAVSPDSRSLAVSFIDGTLSMYDISGYLTSVESELSSANSSLQIYPNPASDKLYIQIGGIEFESAEVKIVNELGIVVKSGNYAGGSAIELDISDLAQGVYFCVVNAGGNVSVGKVVVGR